MVRTQSSVTKGRERMYGGMAGRGVDVGGGEVSGWGVRKKRAQEIWNRR